MQFSNEEIQPQNCRATVRYKKNGQWVYRQCKERGVYTFLMPDGEMKLGVYHNKMLQDDLQSVVPYNPGATNPADSFLAEDMSGMYYAAEEEYQRKMLGFYSIGQELSRESEKIHAILTTRSHTIEMDRKQLLANIQSLMETIDEQKDLKQQKRNFIDRKFAANRDMLQRYLEYLQTTAIRLRADIKSQKKSMERKCAQEEEEQPSAPKRPSRRT